MTKEDCIKNAYGEFYQKYKFTPREAIKKHNDSNPAQKKKTIKSIAIEIGEKNPESITNCYRLNASMIKHLEVIFDPENVDKINENYEFYKNFPTPYFRITKGLIEVLGCKFSDLWSKE